MKRATNRLNRVDGARPTRARDVVRKASALRHDHILSPDAPAGEAAESLATVLRDRPFAPAEALQLARQIADALAHAHAEGVVHGAVGPHAVLIVPGAPARALVTGFAASEAAAPPYVAPEQLRGEDGGAPADVFALGLLVFEMIEGRPLLAGTPEEVTARLLEDATPILPRFARIAPTGLPALVARAIRRPPTGRPTMEQMRGEIDDCLRRLGEISIKSSLGGARPRAVAVIDDTADEVDVDEEFLGVAPVRESRSATPPRPHTAAAAWASTSFAPRVLVGAGTRRGGVPVAGMTLGVVLMLALVALGWPLWHSARKAAPVETAPIAATVPSPTPAAAAAAAPASAAPAAVAPAKDADERETLHATSGARLIEPAAAPVVVAALPLAAPAAAPVRNVPPRITARQPASERVDALEGSAVQFTVRAADKNDDVLAYAWYLDGKKVGSGPRWKFVAPLAATAATHTVAVDVTDAAGLKAPRAAWTVEVGARMLATDVSTWIDRLAGAWQRKDVSTLRLFRIVDTDEEASAIRREFPLFGGKIVLENPSVHLAGSYASVAVDRTLTDVLGRKHTVRDAYQLEKSASGFVAVRR